MDAQQINTFMLTNGKYFPEEKMPLLREQLQNVDDSKYATIVSLQYKNPTTALILSLFLGWIGVDRFYIGDTGFGIGKLLTMFLCLIGTIWVIVDWFLIMGSTREKNFNKLMQYL